MVSLPSCRRQSDTGQADLYSVVILDNLHFPLPVHWCFISLSPGVSRFPGQHLLLMKQDTAVTHKIKQCFLWQRGHSWEPNVGFLVEDFKINLNISLSIKLLLWTVTFRALGFEMHLWCCDKEEAWINSWTQSEQEITSGKMRSWGLLHWSVKEIDWEAGLNEANLELHPFF